MKGKLLFAAALVAAGVAGTQAVRLTNSSWNLQLLENQQLRGVNPLADDAPEAGETAELPTPLAFYDFEEESTDVTFKHFGSGVAPYSVPLSETEKGLQFTGSDNNNMGYIQIANPFKGKSDITTQGATISLWVYLSGNSVNNSIWGFSRGGDGYEDLPILGYEGNSYLTYNNKDNNWIDFNRPGNAYAVANPVQTGQMTMLTFSFGADALTLYVNGEAVNYPTDPNSTGKLTDVLSYMQGETFPYFCVGKGSWTGTFSGKADKLCFYDKALTAEEVQALYDEQKVGLAQDIADVTTEYVENADFSNGTNGWNTGGAPIDANILETNGIPFVSINQWSYGKTFDCTQTLTDLPIGLYRLSAQVSSSTGNSEVLHLTSSIGDSRVGFGNSGMAVADAATKWAQDKEANRVYTGNVLVIDGTATIGMNRNNQRNGEVYFDNFRLEKVGDGFIELADMYANLKNEAEAIDKDALASELKTRLETALTATPSTSEEYVSAYTSLNAVIDLCNAYISECPIETLIETCEAYSQNSASTSATKATFDAAIAAAEAVDLSTVDINGLREAYNALEAARQAFAQNAVPTGEQEFDITFMLTNPNATANVDGWYSDLLNEGEWIDGIETPDINPIGLANNGAYQGETQTTFFVEKWSSAAWEQVDGNGWIIYQKVAVPAGAYKVSAAVFTDKPWNAGADVTGVPVAALTAGFDAGTLTDGAALEWTSGGSNVLKYKETEFTLTEAATAEKPLKLGIYIGADNGADWFGINDMKLYKVAPQAVNLTLNEANAYSVTADTYANVTMTRAMSAKLDGEETAKWNTFCVPFDMTAEQLTANKITKVVQLTAAETTADNGINLTSEEVTDGVKAGVPYLVQVSEDVTEITAEGVYVTAAAPAAQTIGTAGDYTVAMTGNYSAQNVPTNAYFISNNTFYVADAEATVALKGFRAYITLTDDSGEPAQANVRTISIDGNTAGDGTTGIDGVTGEESDKMVDVYTLSGVKVKGGVKASEALDGLQRGVYIVNGKKIIK